MKANLILYEQLRKWAGTRGDKDCIVDVQNDRSIRYKEFTSAISVIQQILGEKPKTIFLILPGGIANSVVWTASLIYGHTLIPLDPAITEREFSDQYAKHHPDTLIADRLSFTFPGHIEVLLQETLEAQIFNKDVQALPEPNKNMPDGLVYLETSGSTGTPKGMLLNTTKIIYTAQQIKEIHELTENDRGFTPLPFFHVNAPVVSLISSLLAGAAVIIAPKFSASRFWHWVETYKPTWISIVPTIVAILLKTERPAHINVSCIRFVRTASSPLPKHNLERFEQMTGLPVIETYGISEAASTIAANPLPPAAHKSGSVGLPLGVAMELRNKITIDQHAVGEVWIQGPQVIDSYVGNADPDSFKNGWFRTGDLGYFDNDGYLFLTGRNKDLIIRGGENIAPREIEEVLTGYPGIQETAVVGKPDPIYGEKVVAYIVAETDTNKADLETFLQNKLTKHKIPEEIIFVPKLPRGRTGKIDKNILKSF